MFCIDNKSNLDLGIVADEENFLARAAIQYNELSIEGKDGSDYIEQKYLNVIGSLTLYILNKKNIDTIFKYFTGKHVLTFGNRKSTIVFYESIPVTRYGTVNSIVVNYIRFPFWYTKNDTKTKCDDRIINVGNVYSRPIIELYGDGHVSITVNEIQFEYTFDNDKKVIIDCENKTETWNDINKSKNIVIGFEYPILYPGINNVEINGNVEVYFSRKDRWL